MQLSPFGSLARSAPKDLRFKGLGWAKYPQRPGGLVRITRRRRPHRAHGTRLQRTARDDRSSRSCPTATWPSRPAAATCSPSRRWSRARRRPWSRWPAASSATSRTPGTSPRWSSCACGRKSTATTRSTRSTPGSTGSPRTSRSTSCAARAAARRPTARPSTSCASARSRPRPARPARPRTAELARLFETVSGRLSEKQKAAFVLREMEDLRHAGHRRDPRLRRVHRAQPPLQRPAHPPQGDGAPVSRVPAGEAARMSPVCAILRESFDDYLGDALPAPQRRMLREHLAACAGCLAAAAAKDASLPLRAADAPRTSRRTRRRAILAGVRAGVGHIETERRIAMATRRRFAGVAAAAAAVGRAAGPDGSGRLRRPPGAGDRGAPRAGSEPGRFGTGGGFFRNRSRRSSGRGRRALLGRDGLRPESRRGPGRAARRLDRGSRARYLTRFSHARAGSERGRGLSFA